MFTAILYDALKSLAAMILAWKVTDPGKTYESTTTLPPPITIIEDTVSCVSGLNTYSMDLNTW